MLADTLAGKKGERLHWVDGPEEESEASERSEESLGLLVFVLSSTSAVVDYLVDNDKVGNTSPEVPAPFLAVVLSISSEETGEDHDNVGHDGNEDVGTAETSQKSKVEQEERSSNAPVDVSCPVDLSVCNLLCVW